MAFCVLLRVRPPDASASRREHRGVGRGRANPASCLLRALVALTATAAPMWAAEAQAVRRPEPGPVGLAQAPTPTLPSLLELERRQLVPAAAKERARIAADRFARHAALQASRTAAPMAADAAARDHDLADAARDVALIAWHQGHLACEGLLKPAPPSRGAVRRAKTPPPPPPVCPPPPLAIDEVIAAYQRVLAQRPQYRRADDVRFQLAQLSLRQAREDNDPGRALQARAALMALEESLAPGVLRDHTQLWLAEDDAVLGRDDLALQRWDQLARARNAEFATIYARLRLAWAHWGRGRTAVAVERLAPSLATKSTSPWQEQQRAHHAWMVARMRASAAAAASAASTAAAAKASLAPTPAADIEAPREKANGQRPEQAKADGKAALGGGKAAPGDDSQRSAKPEKAADGNWPRQPTSNPR